MCVRTYYVIYMYIVYIYVLCFVVVCSLCVVVVSGDFFNTQLLHIICCIYIFIYIIIILYFRMCQSKALCHQFSPVYLVCALHANGLCILYVIYNVMCIYCNIVLYI